MAGSARPWPKRDHRQGCAAIQTEPSGSHRDLQYLPWQQPQQAPHAGCGRQDYRIAVRLAAEQHGVDGVAKDTQQDQYCTRTQACSVTSCDQHYASRDQDQTNDNSSGMSLPQARGGQDGDGDRQRRLKQSGGAR